MSVARYRSPKIGWPRMTRPLRGHPTPIRRLSPPAHCVRCLGVLVLLPGSRPTCRCLRRDPVTDLPAVLSGGSVPTTIGALHRQLPRPRPLTPVSSGGAPHRSRRVHAFSQAVVGRRTLRLRLPWATNGWRAPKLITNNGVDRVFGRSRVAYPNRQPSALAAPPFAPKQRRTSRRQRRTPTLNTTFVVGRVWAPMRALLPRVRVG